MFTIVWPTVDIAASAHPVCLSELFSTRFLIVVRRAQGGEPIERRKCFERRALLPALFGDRDAVVDNFSSHNDPFLQACFATRMLR
jgi:hypothetical protein